MFLFCNYQTYVTLFMGLGLYSIIEIKLFASLRNWDDLSLKSNKFPNQKSMHIKKFVLTDWLVHHRYKHEM